MKKFFTPAFLLLICLSFTRLNAQVYVDWHNYNTYSSVQCMLDMDTSILAGTNGGIASINKTTQAVTYINKNDSLLPAEIVHCLEKDTAGNLWIGTDCGIARYINANWYYYTTQNSLLPSNNVTALHYNQATHTLWVGLYDGNVLTFNSLGWTRIGDTLANKPGSTITSIVVDATGKTWIGTAQNGLFLWNGVNWTVYTTANSPVGLNVRSLALDNNDKLWIANPTILVGYNGTVWESHIVSGCNNLQHISIAANNNVNISAACGILSFNGTNFSWLTAGAALTDSVLLWHIIDNSNIWTGTHASGVDQISSSSTVTNILLKPGLRYPGVISFDFSVSSQAWIAYNNTPVATLSNLNGTTWTHYPPTNTPMGTAPITCTQLQGTTKLWIGTFGNGAFTKSGNTWTPYNRGNSNILSDSVTALGISTNNFPIVGFYSGAVQVKTAFPGFSPMVDAAQVGCPINRLYTVNGITWMATESNGLIKYNPAALIFYKTNNSEMPSNRVLDIKEDINHLYYIATDAGLVTFDGDTTWAVYTTSNSTLPSNNITCLCLGKDSSMWIGTKDAGLCRIKNGIWTVYDQCNSKLASNSIQAVDVAPNGKIYIGTINGMTVITLDAGVGETEISRSADVIVYPNPASDQLTFTFNIPGATKGLLQVYTAMGQVVLNKNANFSNDNRFNFIWDINNYPNTIKPGLYFYTLQGDFNPQSGKILIVK